jgi:hypothetical protein
MKVIRVGRLPRESVVTVTVDGIPASGFNHGWDLDLCGLAPYINVNFRASQRPRFAVVDGRDALVGFDIEIRCGSCEEAKNCLAMLQARLQIINIDQIVSDAEARYQALHAAELRAKAEWIKTDKDSDLVRALWAALRQTAAEKAEALGGFDVKISYLKKQRGLTVQSLMTEKLAVNRAELIGKYGEAVVEILSREIVRIGADYAMGGFGCSPEPDYSREKVREVYAELGLPIVPEVKS